MSKKLYSYKIRLTCMEPQHSAAQPRKTDAVKVILDSNAFFVPLEFKMDIFEEVRRLVNRNLEFVLLSSVKRELEILASDVSPKVKREAFFALKLAEKCKFIPVDDKGEE